MTFGVKKITFVLSLLFLICLISGCLETPRAQPATIDENALEEYGWSLISTEENSFEQAITESTSIVLNSTTVKYNNDRMTSEINEQVTEFRQNNNLPVSLEVPESLSARIITYRLSLPSGAKLPTEIISKIMDNKVSEIESSNDIQSTQETNTRKLTMADGTETVVKIFTSAGNSTNTGMKMMGFVTAFESEDSSTVVMGFVPDGEYRIENGIINGTLFSIDGDSKIDEMLELVSTIE